MEIKPGAISGSSLARTITPTIPANFLSRNRLFPLFQRNSPGATLVVAPAGYGKSTLVSEWAAQDPRPTFWYSVDINDSIQEFSSFLLHGIRQHFPDLGKDSPDVQRADPITALSAINKEVAALGVAVNVVIDNGSADNEQIAEFAQGIIDMLANNIHIVLVRRLTPDTSLARYASVGNLSLITSQDLKFNSEEILKIAKLNGMNLEDEQILNDLDICEGWPAAVQMLSRNFAMGKKTTDFSAIANDPLKILALETYNTLAADNKSKLLRLSLLREFDLETAKIILGDDFSEAYINKLATDGAFVTASAGMHRTYRFSPLVFETLSEINESSDPKFKELHGKLAEHFVTANDLTKALEHSFQSGDTERFMQILRPAIREMAQIGRGDELIRWSRYSGDGSKSGDIRQLIVKGIGHLVNLNYEKAEAAAIEAQFLIENSSSERASQVDLILSFVFFARGEMEKAKQYLDRAIKTTDSLDVGRNEDLISLYRLSADMAFIQDDYDKVEELYFKARELHIDQSWVNTAYQIKCMEAMYHFGEGNLFQAAEAANVAVTQADSGRYSGVFGALDALVVLARCELEFSHLDKSISYYQKVIDLSSRWRIWPWNFLAEGSIIRIEVVRGKIELATNIIAEQRKLLSSFPRTVQLDWMIDMSEAFLRFVIDDYDRADQLTQRLPKIDMVKQLDFNAEVRKNPGKIESVLAALPAKNSRQRVFKWMSEVHAYSSQENVALKSLRKAVELGSEVGFHESFARQNKLYPLFVKLASQQPTFYLENLVREMTERIQSMNADTGSLEEKLTSRELEILKHLETGNPISAIAKQLHISQNTMKTHLRNVYRKLSADGRHTAVEKAKKLLLI